MFTARNKQDLMIEVWEKLDCESVGAAEILAIEAAVIGQYGKQAVDSPMVIARLLSDEGAILRHAEIMELYVERATGDPYEAAFRNIVVISDLGKAAASLKRLENLRRKYLSDGDDEGLRRVKECGVEARVEAIDRAQTGTIDPNVRARYAEIAEWFTLWLQSPEMFEAWIELRRSSRDFRDKFAENDHGNGSDAAAG
ncbi:MAG: hypothetical protein AB7Q37_00680 [Pyrinomonadaceae bacterium]